MSGTYSRQPKRPCSGYICFALENRTKEAAANPTLTPKSLLAHLGELWRGLKAEDKQKYLDLAAADKQRFERQSEEYKKEGRFYDEAGKIVLLPEKAEKAKKPRKAEDEKAKRGRMKSTEVAN